MPAASCEEKNVHAVNTLAVVNRAIAKLKTILSSYLLVNWADSIQKATNAYNEKSHSYLMGSAPDDVNDSKPLQYELDKMNGEQKKAQQPEMATKGKAAQR